MDARARPRGAPDLSALIAACIAGVDRPMAIRALNSRLVEIAGADETASPLLRAVENLLDGVRAGSVTGVEQAMVLVESAAGLLADRDGTRVQTGVSDHRLDLIERPGPHGVRRHGRRPGELRALVLGCRAARAHATRRPVHASSWGVSMSSRHRTTKRRVTNHGL